MRLAELESRRDLVDQRDDLTIELVSLYNFTGQSDRALAILLARRFHPWEGGEGLVSGQYVAAHMLLGVEALGGGNAGDALSHFGGPPATIRTTSAKESIFSRGKHTSTTLAAWL